MNNIQKVALVGNSNPPKDIQEVYKIEQVLTKLGLDVVLSPTLLERTLFNGAKKAQIMNEYYADNTIDAIFDISGGDTANGVLNNLDYSLIRNQKKKFYGYSDITTVLNSLISQSDQSVELFQVSTLVWDKSGKQINKFKASFLNDTDDLYQTAWKFIQGSEIKGVVIGGNIRCFLKLAGTRYMPDLTNKILFLESLGGGEENLYSMVHQLKELDKFDRISGLLLGTFTYYQENYKQSVEQLIQNILMDNSLPIAKTEEIGHGRNSNSLKLGDYINISKSIQ
ncbi:S66 peptidase family protein [Corticicoccus populi]|uniref:LD-carboxypeptidase n=1 Tax=Corticicoccus populi TaxID=1812821 RepID=A0ABW5WSY1_9STAP